MAFKNIGTPDWQRGSVNAGKLLATVAANTSSTSVDLTPNTRTLVIVVPSGTQPTAVDVQGRTTGTYYPGTVMVNAADATAGIIYAFTVSPETDQTVTVTCSPTPSSSWYVYANSGIQIVSIAEIRQVTAYDGQSGKNYGLVVMGFDGTYAQRIKTNANGNIVPLVPTVGVDKAVLAGTTQLIAAPASGGNYIFAVDVIDTSGGANTLSLVDGSGNTLGKVALATADPSYTIELQGFRVTTALSVVAVASADIVVRYAPGP